MGLFTGLLLLPLAPVRGTAWLAERLQEQAEAELDDDTVIRSGLLELEALREEGELDEEELARAEDALLEQLLGGRGWEGHGERQ
jgi:hypothetical protein